MYSEDLKRRIRDGTNLVDLVQSAVGKLTRAGRNFKACCPFHNEKTPSFNINVEGQFFKCFGCGKGGDVFTFVMLYDRCEFPEAMKILADRAGIRIEIDAKSAEQYKKETDWKSYLYKFNDAASKFYQEQLYSASGKPARDYLKKRGLSDEICEKYALGYAPATGSPLLSRLQSLKAPLAAIVRAGLASQREDGSARDFFFDRLMFPITDIQGRIIAFGGRTLGDGEPKYLNTRETPVFSKTKTVYGLNLAKDEIVKTRQAILVEGYTDVMMCHQFGITNVVACLGTAITAEHIRQLRRVADEVLLLTDSDKAGAKASERSLGVLFQEEMPARVARLPYSDKDPCDFLLAHGKELFLKAIVQSMDLFEYKFDTLKHNYDLSKPLGLKQAADDLMALISLIPDTLLKNQYRYEILRRLNIRESDLRYETAGARANPPRESTHDSGYGNLGSVTAPQSELAAAEREFLKFLYHEPAWLEQAATQLNLSALSGQPEACIGAALVIALQEGRLPPDAVTLADGDAGSIVAREVLKYISSSTKAGLSGIGLVNDNAKSLCISLAELPRSGSKLDAAARFDMLLRKVREKELYLRHKEATQKLTCAKLNGDVEGAQRADEQLAQLRRDIGNSKSH